MKMRRNSSTTPSSDSPALLDQNAAQQDPERTHITAEGKIFGGIGGARSQLGEPAALVVIAPTSTPKRRVTHVQS